MGKLELKHLAPYLPYNLKVADISGKIKLICHYTPKSQPNLVNIGDVMYDSDKIMINKYKPILRPLTDLKNISQKEYEDLNKKFGIIPSHLWSFNKIIELSHLNHYDLITYLISKHYDVFSLIEKGLAIDINTLNNG